MVDPQFVIVFDTTQGYPDLRELRKAFLGAGVGMGLDKIKRVRLQAEVEKSVRSYIDENRLQEGDPKAAARAVEKSFEVTASTIVASQKTSP